MRLPRRSSTYLVALSAGLASSSSSASLGAVAGDVTGLAALVAGLVVLHGLSAVTAWEKSACEQE